VTVCVVLPLCLLRRWPGHWACESAWRVGDSGAGFLYWIVAVRFYSPPWLDVVS